MLRGVPFRPDWSLFIVAVHLLVRMFWILSIDSVYSFMKSILCVYLLSIFYILLPKSSFLG